MIPNFSNQQKKAEFLRIRDYAANPRPLPDWATKLDDEQLENRIFHFIDAELGVKRTPDEARTYKKIVKNLNRQHLMNEHYIRALEKKANRFLDKKSIGKEKGKIKEFYRDEAILGALG